MLRFPSPPAARGNQMHTDCVGENAAASCVWLQLQGMEGGRAGDANAERRRRRFGARCKQLRSYRDLIFSLEQDFKVSSSKAGLTLAADVGGR